MRAQNLVSVEEAALEIGIPPWCLYKWIHEEDVPHGLRNIPNEGKRAIVNVSSVRVWMKRHHKDHWIGFGKRKVNADAG